MQMINIISLSIKCLPDLVLSPARVNLIATRPFTLICICNYYIIDTHANQYYPPL